MLFCAAVKIGSLAIFSVPYILLELPMNLLMKRIGANITLPIMVALWGMVCACQGAVKTYGGLLACRFFLGALEGMHELSLQSGVQPYAHHISIRWPISRDRALYVLLLQTPRHAAALLHDVQCDFSCGRLLRPLAAGIQHMDGLRGLPGWAWIFILVCLVLSAAHRS